ncbi:hypothetical protein [Roseospira navarrensis]|uniref:Uncharacterized protein n=1 Tax=Roseospira navarrensis TaxID=140058 RepID=A0A7X1ZC19_9PROT|nr:hypothetical protein [Roseospira navarrensis]MQX35780.1 hypothetical protein [Roseospira navarrensis]
MTGAEWGLVGGIAGAVIGVLGGAIGSWASIRNARPGGVRRFMVRATVGLWAIMALLGTLIALSLTGTLPTWVIWATQGVFFVGLGPAIVLMNRHLRHLEASDDGASPR